MVGGVITMSRREQIINGVAALVISNYEGDYQKAFDAYSGDEKTLSVSKLEQILKDAHIGGFFRELYAEGILKELDKNQDRVITWEEFADAFNGD